MDAKQSLADASAISAGSFNAWWLERATLEQALREAGDQENDYTEGLLSKLHELEKLIIETPSSDLEGIRTKARLLAWLMDMETADGREAMRHILEFLERQ